MIEFKINAKKALRRSHQNHIQLLVVSSESLTSCVKMKAKLGEMYSWNGAAPKPTTLGHMAWICQEYVQLQDMW